jgi:hypothetical protein
MSPRAVVLHLVYISTTAAALHPSTSLPVSALLSKLIMSLPVTSLPQKCPPPLQLLLSSSCCCSLHCRMSTKVASLLYPSRSYLWQLLLSTPFRSPRSACTHTHTHTQTHGRSGLGAAFLAYQPGARRFPHARGPPSTSEGGGGGE